MAHQMLIALFMCFICSALFGSMFVPMKRYNPGDGLFAQWLMCSAIWFVGFGVFLYTGYQDFYPFAMLGGFSWCLGNLITVPIITELGLGLSLLLFSVMNTTTCFLVSTFGLLGTHARPADYMWLNVTGLVLVAAGGVLTSFVKPRPAVVRASGTQVEEVSRKDRKSTINIEKSFDTLSTQSDIVEIVDQPDTSRSAFRRKIAFLGAFIAGILYGLNMVPIVFIQDNEDLFDNVKAGGMPYVFSQFCGVYLTSTVAFIGYGLFKKNKPLINPEVALPSLLCGLMWGVGQTMSIITTEALSQGISGPITAMVPGCVATVWSLLYFKEIETGKNLYVLWTSIGLTMTGAICIGLSRM
ncbi:unnamed protein product [Bursaphelenchus xylophilus]|uniref:(pine wood nematode) hypothetical protein n=1 Tax=Bursaphelenchus xylophilus TaxID=6326 RepID=A0A1I7SCU4_BURXY|nr:unnamed protein product [Bursaphelenchus xylophilus]CAG9093469.1 unnamed protein product [Bursaphelenchus xylophilus]